MKANKKFKSARKFFDFFLPHNWDTSTIFRGHRDSNWELIPTLYRLPNLTNNEFGKSFQEFEKNFHTFFGNKYTNNQFGSSPDRNDIKAFKMFCFEKVLIHEFIKYSNKLGLPLQGSAKALDTSKVFDSNQNEMVEPLEWDPDYSKLHVNSMPNVAAPEPFVAMAQHHGIPTKLLDFSYNPLAALFFASEYSEKESNEEIAVYSTLLSDYYYGGNYSFYDFAKKDASLSGMYGILRVPNSDNEYLYKQGGLFLYPKYPYSFYLKFDRYPNLEDHGKIRNMSGSNYSNIQKYTLPGSEKAELRELLKKSGVTKSSLMPTFDNVVQDIKADFLTKKDFWPFNY